ncbi:MAG TPA: hypothetical protein VFV46_05625 [Lacibacter sp.]|nr:hypothetical protein [Lacibacter sp.]
MNQSATSVQQLFSSRRSFGHQETAGKLQLLNAVELQHLKSKTTLQLYHDTLLFLMAYADTKQVYKLAQQKLEELQLYIQSNKTIQYRLYNTGITGTKLCAAFGFEITKWLRKRYSTDIRIDSFEAPEGQMQSIVCAMMTKLESEILQDSYFTWQEWMERSLATGETILDGLLSVFDNNNTRPEVKDELWTAMGVNTEIQITTPIVLPASLIQPYFHKELLRKPTKLSPATKAVKVKLNDAEAAAVLDCSRMILVRHLREIDPISFTDARFVSYYQLPRGLSIALMEMIPERRHPVDSYMGYTVFKNGLPVAYAGSWLLFDSGRIGLNIFPAYRGGESQYIFQQILNVHAQVYKLKRLTVDPYQIGGKNSDGINSGAFWVYYHAGFRPMEKEQLQLANSEAEKIKTIKGYRSPAAVLKQLAKTKMELQLSKKSVRFDANDLSLAYAAILQKKFKNNRIKFEKDIAKQLASILKLTIADDPMLEFTVQNWALLLLPHKKELQQNPALKKSLKELFLLKAKGSETAYHFLLEKNGLLRGWLEKLVKEVE